MVSPSSSSSLSAEIRDVLKLQVGAVGMKIPDVVPVIDVNPKHARVCNIVKANSRITTGSSTVYTTPATQDFFLSTATLSMVKDAACDQATGIIGFTAVIDGATVQLLQFPVITLTAQQYNQTIEFPIPIKIDRNTGITSTGTYAAGVMARSFQITGYIVDNSNA